LPRSLSLEAKAPGVNGSTVMAALPVFPWFFHPKKRRLLQITYFVKEQIIVHGFTAPGLISRKPDLFPQKP
jgi:hypothetical protein